jgi:glycosyltransferase involved in cell wall biosynthesis
MAALAAGALALPGLLAAAGPARRWLETEQAALIHTNGIKAHLWGGWLGRWTGRPVVCHLRDLLGTRWLDERIAAEIGRTAAAIITPSEAVARRLRGQRPPVTVVPNGLDLERVRPAPAPGPDGGGPRVGIVGPLTPGKGQHVFLRAAALVQRAFPQARFVVVGDEPYETWGSRGERPRLERLAQALGIAPAVTFTGFVEDPLAWIGRCDVLVSASTTPEGFGREPLEAMALGKPVIATALGASPEVGEDDVVREHTVAEVELRLLQRLAEERGPV